MKLGQKLALLMFAFGVVFLGVTQLFFYFHERHLAVESASEATLRLANEVAHRLEIHLQQKAETVAVLSAATNIQDALKRSNEEYATLPRAQ
ncbi:MAG: hypothetical protein KAS94_11775, partial [Desulfobulbaceae bacterium]|nr:hypothetical protein [Desulfobulbaceae bacterium]